MVFFIIIFCFYFLLAPSFSANIFKAQGFGAQFAKSTSFKQSMPGASKVQKSKSKAKS
jgi:hypothetical protein